MSYIGLKKHRYKASKQPGHYEWIEPDKKCNPPAHLVNHLLDIVVIEPLERKFETKSKADNKESFEVIEKGGGWVSVVDSEGNEVDKGRGKDDLERLTEKYG